VVRVLFFPLAVVAAVVGSIADGEDRSWLKGHGHMRVLVVPGRRSRDRSVWKDFELWDWLFFVVIGRVSILAPGRDGSVLLAASATEPGNP